MKQAPLNLLLLSLAIAVLGLATYYFAFVVPGGEIGRKEQYATLQSLELKHRDDGPAAHPLMLENALGSSYSVLGIPTRDPRTPRAWVILNESTADGSVFAVPDNASLRLSCSYVAQLEKTTRIDAAVLRFLQGACTGAP